MLPQPPFFPETILVTWTPAVSNETCSTSSIVPLAPSRASAIQPGTRWRPRPACAHADPGHCRFVAPRRLACERQKASIGRYRKHLRMYKLSQKRAPTKLAVANSGLFRQLEGKWRAAPLDGPPQADFARSAGANARSQWISQTSSRMEVFVTSGNPSGKACLKPTGPGP